MLLYACGYDNLSFIRSGHLAQELSDHVRAFTDRHLVAAALSGVCAARLRGDDVLAAGARAAPGVGAGSAAKPVSHIPLLRRPREMSVEEKLKKHGLPCLGAAGMDREADE